MGKARRRVQKPVKGGTGPQRQKGKYLTPKVKKNFLVQAWNSFSEGFYSDSAGTSTPPLSPSLSSTTGYWSVSERRTILRPGPRKRDSLRLNRTSFRPKGSLSTPSRALSILMLPEPWTSGDRRHEILGPRGGRETTTGANEKSGLPGGHTGGVRQCDDKNEIP